MDAATAYRRRSIEGASPVGLVVLLYQSACVEMRRAAAAIEAGDIEARTRALNKVLAIVGELRAALDFERGGAIAHQFAALYRLAERGVLEASARQDAAPLREVLEQFVLVRDAWQKIEAQQGAAAAAPEAAWPA